MQIKNFYIPLKLFAVKWCSSNAHISLDKIDELITSKANKQGKQNHISDKYNYCGTSFKCSFDANWLWSLKIISKIPISISLHPFFNDSCTYI